MHNAVARGGGREISLSGPVPSGTRVIVEGALQPVGYGGGNANLQDGVPQCPDLTQAPNAGASGCEV